MMNKKKIIIITLFVIILLVVGCVYIHMLSKKPDTKPDDNKTNEAVVVEKENKNDFSFLKLENYKQNIVYSPYSINTAFYMLSLGANGNTEKELKNFLGDFKLVNYGDIDNKLSVANGTFINNLYKDTIKKSYLDELQSKFNNKVEVMHDDFNSVENINKWVSKKTFELIPSILEEGQVDSETRIVLANALAFKMDWVDKFDANDTYGGDFYLEDGSKIVATTLSKKAYGDSISYYKGDNVTALAMDLEKIDETQFELLAIMPEDLSEYIKNVKVSDINDIDSKLVKASSEKNGIRINIPKFKFDYQLELKKDLIELGLKDTFSPGVADLSKISDRDLYVSDCVHKATIDFSEDGVKASAATVIISKEFSSIEEKPIIVSMDKPFMFIIRDKKTKDILFVGSVYSPNLWDDDRNLYIEQ